MNHWNKQSTSDAGCALDIPDFSTSLKKKDIHMKKIFILFLSLVAVLQGWAFEQEQDEYLFHTDIFILK